MKDRWPNSGLLALLVAASGLVTGVFLAFNYAPTLEAARDSVRYIQEGVTLGWLLRGLHHWAGNLALVLAALHGWRIFWHGAYKAPRRALWALGCLIFLVLLGFAYTGYLLPGDQRAYTGLGVMEGVAGSTPAVGEQVSTVLKGGDALSSATLARIYTVHTVLLPAALLGLVVAFVAAWLQRGPARHHADESEDLSPVPVAALRRDAAYGIAVLALLALLAWLLPPALGPKPDLADAAAPDAKPEWFFLWVNEALRLAGGHTFLVGAVLPAALVALAFLLPLVCRGPERAPRRRKPEIIAALLVLGAVGGLTVSSLAAGTSAPVQPAPPSGPAGDLDTRAAQIMEKFKCRSCHVIDGGESDQETGPPLTRRATADLPAFGALYRREFFRRKVADPKKLWPETSMRYTPKRLKPTPEEIAVLERWFFLDDEE